MPSSAIAMSRSFLARRLQSRAELAHVHGQPVAAVVAPAAEVLEVRRIVCHRVADDVLLLDAVPRHEVADQSQARFRLSDAGQDLLVRPVTAGARLLDELDTDGDVVKTDAVA